MGFSDLGRSILRNNDRLRRNLGDRYFRFSKSETQFNKSEVDGEIKKYLPKLEVKSKDSDYRYLNRSNITTLALIGAFTVLSYMAFDKYYGRAHAEYVTKLESLIYFGETGPVFSVI